MTGLGQSRLVAMRGIKGRARRLAPGRARWIAPIGAVLAISASALALAGSTPDPDIHDVVFGKAHGLRYASDTVPFDLGNSGFVSTESGCGSGPRSTIGGGIRTQGPGPAGIGVSSSEPNDWYDTDLDPDDGWRASATGTSAGTLTVFSVCGKFAPRYRYRSVSAQPGKTRLAKVPCGGKHWSAVSGGGLIATSGSRINSSYPYDGPDTGSVPEGWATRVFDTIGGSGGFSAYAVCVKASDQMPVYLSDKTAKVKPGHVAKRKLTCASPSHAVAVGIRISGKGGEAEITNGFPFDGDDEGIEPDDGFRTAAFNRSGKLKKVTSTLICLG
jgi:hypothetical protein